MEIGRSSNASDSKTNVIDNSDKDTRSIDPPTTHLPRGLLRPLSDRSPYADTCDGPPEDV